jgi:CYTH domain-containing protein
MKYEHERKFLVSRDWQPEVAPLCIAQRYFWPMETATGHISDAFEFVLRPRASSREWRLQLPAADAQALHAANPDYLGKKWNIRFRRSTNIAGETEHCLTLKGPETDETRTSRPEFEYPVNPQEVEWLWHLCADTHVEKNRYKVGYGGLIWDVDHYFGHMTELNFRRAEVETPAKDTVVTIPPWALFEVTEYKGFSDAAFARRKPIPQIPGYT